MEKYELTERQYEIIREALEIYYYHLKDEGDRRTMRDINELETILINQKGSK